MGEEEGATKSKEEMEGGIETAMRARVSDFKAKADSLTLEGVRRALEEDLGLKKFSLDSHKRFIKQCLQECFNSADHESVSKKSDIETSTPMKEENPGDSRDTQPSLALINSDTADQEKEGSPDLNKVGNHEKEDFHCSEPGPDISEDTIKDAINRRAAYFRTHSESINLVAVRRTLEQDLKLEKKALDAYKSLITKELDKVLQPPKKESNNGVKKNLQKVAKKMDEISAKKGSKRNHEEFDSSEVNGPVSEDEEDNNTKSKKREMKKIKASAASSERQKKLANDKLSTSKVKKPMEADSERSSAHEGGSSSDEKSTVEKIKKKQEKPPQVYSKQAEHLKSVIKSCGMSVPPSIYKKVKQAPESKREAYLIRELEEILGKEGLSSDPSEKEIKAVKKKKERAKELEGIDMSNIITSSRRRTTSSYVPPKPKIEIKENDYEESDDENGDENDDENEQESDDDSGAKSDDGSDEGAEDESY